ncbi:MAG: hypothetical protein DWQ02_10060 [Bacteroidetes bacterium]|nr:MAG: hypothetical protein DWQ02_10060 [Bacteroidota bacterium]
MEKVLFWTFIGIFSITAIITLLGITGVLKSIKERYLNVLFTSLILEVVAAVLILFKSTDFSSETNYSSLFDKAGIADEAALADPEGYILTQLTENNKNSDALQQRDSLSELLKEARQLLEDCEGEVGQLDKSFFTKISRLRILMYDFDGYITLNFREDGKKEVFTLLGSIFESLQLVNSEKDLYLDNNELNTAAVKSKYNSYKRSYISLPLEKQNQYYIIFQSDIAKMLRDYLDLIKE